MPSVKWRPRSWPQWFECVATCVEIKCIQLRLIWCIVVVDGTRYALDLIPFQWRHNDHDGVSNHQPHDCLPNRLFMRRSKKTSKLCFTGLCEGNSPVTGELPTRRASNAENNSIWWRHHANWSRINEYSAFSKSFVSLCKLQWNFFIIQTFSKKKILKRAFYISPARATYGISFVSS